MDVVDAAEDVVGSSEYPEPRRLLSFVEINETFELSGDGATPKSLASIFAEKGARGEYVLGFKKCTTSVCGNWGELALYLIGCKKKSVAELSDHGRNSFGVARSWLYTLDDRRIMRGVGGNGLCVGGVIGSGGRATFPTKSLKD